MITQKNRERIPLAEISAVKMHNGAWEVAAIVGGVRVCRVYYDYTRPEAISAFRDEMQGEAR